MLPLTHPGTSSSRYRLLLIGLLTLFVATMTRAATRGPMLQNLQRDRVTVWWETDRPAEGNVHVYGESGEQIATISTTGSRTPQEVVLEGLEPDTVYAYEVVAGAKKDVLGKGRFRTAPGPGRPITFVAWGDSRGGERLLPGLSKLIMKTGAEFSIHTGDIVDDGKQLYQWDKTLFGPCRELLANTVFWPAVGNHDTGLMPKSPNKVTVFEHMFALPHEETYYSFDYGDAHFLVLDSTALNDEQVAFAEKDLAATRARWRIAAWHHPPYSSSHHPSDIATRRRICPLLAKYNVDLLISGHNHNFMLSKPIRHIYVPQQKRPYIQLVTGGGGAYPADFHEGDRWFDRAEKAFHIVAITIDGDRLEGKALHLNGKVLDRFEIDKSKPAPEGVAYELIELERYLRALNIANSNFPGWPSGLILEPGARTGRLEYQVRNPLPEPLRVEMAFDLSPALKFDEKAIEATIDPEATKVMAASFEVVSEDNLYPLKGPVIRFESPVGSAEVTCSAPPLALRKEIGASRIDAAPEIDGQMNDAVWDAARRHERFITWTAGDLDYQARSSAIQSVHDGQRLYLAFRRSVTESMEPRVADSMSDTDHFSIYLASAGKALGVRGDITGRHSFEGTKGLDEGVELQFSRTDDDVSWEISIPLDAFLSDLPDDGQGLYFNVFERRRGDYFTFSPTFRQHANRENSARLSLEGLAGGRE